VSTANRIYFYHRYRLCQSVELELLPESIFHISRQNTVICPIYFQNPHEWWREQLPVLRTRRSLLLSSRVLCPVDSCDKITHLICNAGESNQLVYSYNLFANIRKEPLEQYLSLYSLLSILLNGCRSKCMHYRE